MLEQIRQQDVVEEFSAPVFSLQLVLTVPHHARTPHAAHSANLAQTPSAQNPYLRQAFMEGGANKKTVKFEAETSGERFIQLLDFFVRVVFRLCDLTLFPVFIELLSCFCCLV